MRKPRIRDIELVAQGHTTEIGTQVCWTSQSAHTQPSHPSAWDLHFFWSPVLLPGGSAKARAGHHERKARLVWQPPDLGLSAWQSSLMGHRPCSGGLIFTWSSRPDPRSVLPGMWCTVERCSETGAGLQATSTQDSMSRRRQEDAKLHAHTLHPHPCLLSYVYQFFLYHFSFILCLLFFCTSPLSTLF